MSITQKSDTLTGLTTRQSKYINGLRDVVDFLEANPDLISSIPYSGFVSGPNDPAALVALMRQVGGRWDKRVDDDTFKAVRTFGPHKVTLFTGRENVCERVVTGVETITREVPDPARVAEIPTILVTEEIERVEWVCPPSLLAQP